MRTINDRDAPMQAALEAVLFAASEPLSFQQLAGILGVGPAYLENLIEALHQRYTGPASGIHLLHLDGGYQLLTKPGCASYVKHLRGQPSNLSDAALEVLAVVAYRQPVTRVEVESVRGVDCVSPLHRLQEAGLIRRAGRSQDPGRPFLYETTPRFLHTFGLPDLQHLPDLPEAGSG